ncbi:MAG: preprotein translocase subunit SecG [Rhizobacter sp.]|nr:preprotein translocase subunit SecG [Rhizobacter sp.]
MHVLLNIVVVAQILAALIMIGLVLIQHGKGADMGASFGSGASGSLFGATGSANFLSRSTAVCAAVFFACTVGLAYLSHQQGPITSGGSVLDRAAIPASAPASGAALIPGSNNLPAAGTPNGSAASAAPATAAPIGASGAAAIPSK